MEILNEEAVSRTLDGASSISPFEELKKQVEAILFAAENAMEVSEIRNIIGEVSLSDVRLALKDLMADYAVRSFFLFECGGKYQLRTRPEYAELVRKQFVSKPRSLSKSALETLAIVAYRQPVTRSEVNTIRQVDSSSIMTALKEKDLIAVAGQRKEVGSPMEYKTTQRFLETFGLKNLSDLPSLRSLQMKPEDQEQMAQALASLNGELPEEPPLTAADLAFADQAAEPEVPSLEAGETPLEAGETTLEAGETTLEAGETTLEAGETTLEAGETTLEAGETTLEAGETPLEGGQIILEAAELTDEFETPLEGGQIILEAAELTDEFETPLEEATTDA